MRSLILIYDDDAGTGCRYRERLQALDVVAAQFDVQCVDKECLHATVQELERRRTAARKGNEGQDTCTECSFDRADILFLDFDLVEAGSLGLMTGEALAYLARCYSRCGAIVALNQFGDNTFDLTLKGHPESYADLNIGSSQIDQSGLWRSTWDGLRPWGWPLLPDLVVKYRQRVEELLATGLDRPIVDLLGIPTAVSELLPRSTAEFITKRGGLEDTTAREFVMTSGSGLRGRDLPFGEEAVARIAAARVSKWLERHVLPGQDVLVDAPHLASRYPSLLTGDPATLEAWSQTVALTEEAGLGMDTAKITAAALAKRQWLSRPVWLWSHVSRCEEIAEVVDPWSAASPAFAFCEDISGFVPQAAARQFVAELPSPFARRWVVDPNSQEGAAYSQGLGDVQYSPSIRFSL